MALVVFLAFIVCYGLKQGWAHTIGYGLRWIADKIENVGVDVAFTTIHPFGFVADVFRKVDHVVAHALAVAALNCEKSAVQLFHWGGQVFWWSVHETKALALDTYHAISHVVTHTVPDAAKWAYREALSGATAALHKEAALRRAADKELAHVAHVAEADAQAGIRKADHALDWSEAQVGHINDYIKGLEGRVTRLAQRLSRASIVALIGATIFTEFGLGWLRCANVGRMGRTLCGMPIRLLEDLVGLLSDYFIFKHLCQVVPLLEDGYTEIAAPAIAQLTKEIDKMPCVAGKHGPTLTVPELHLPAHPRLSLSLP